MSKEIKECFKSALRDEKKGKKHKGLLITRQNNILAEKYLNKARRNLKLSEIYKENGFEYLIPESWYYSLYYCAIAILYKFGIETRSQRCTASFLRYVKKKGLIAYDDEFISRIEVYRHKDDISDVDEREEARYGPDLENQDVAKQYNSMNKICQTAIDQCKEIIYSDEKFEVPKELVKK